jgi:hypothetical protein
MLVPESGTIPNGPLLSSMICRMLAMMTAASLVSLDGYVAGPNGELHRLTTTPDPQLE